MRDVNRLQRALILLALYVWLWIDSLADFYSTVWENRRGLTKGAADEGWQHTLHDLAEPIREHRLLLEALENSGEHAVLPPAPVLAVPVVMSDGTTTVTVAAPAPRKRNHRAVKATLMKSGAPEVLAVERRVRKQLDTVVREAMLALGLSAEEVRAVLGVKQFERTLDNVMGLA
jgi:hypothetical protein